LERVEEWGSERVGEWESGRAVSVSVDGVIGRGGGGERGDIVSGSIGMI
jgi:hypothetical protein